jgi:hypothetical protein
LYRCRRCDGLFEATLFCLIWTHLSARKRANQPSNHPKNGHARAGSKGLHRAILSSGLDASDPLEENVTDVAAIEPL